MDGMERGRGGEGKEADGWWHVRSAIVASCMGQETDEI